MLLKHTISKLKYKPFVCQILPLRYSALFINGPKATENYIFLIPHTDLPEQLKDKDVLLKMINKRKSNFDVEKLENLWNVYMDLKNRKQEHDIQKNELTKQLTDLFKTEADSKKIEQIKIKIHLIKDNLKNLKVPLWSAEEAAYIEALKLPNALHPLTPECDNNVIYEHSKPPKFNKSHLTVGKKHNLIKFTQNNSYYLLDDAAVFELGSKMFFSNYLRENNFIQFSCPDFVKSLVVEGCGVNHTDPKSTFMLHDTENTEINEDKRLHLTGAGSICSFFAYHAKNVIFSKVLPLKYFAMGRLYTPTLNIEPSLFNVSQSSVVQMFIAVRNTEEVNIQLDNTVKLVKNIYSQLNFNYRLSYVPADKLHQWESLRLAIEMYSPSQNRYVEIGNVSISGDYVSKRLMFTYMDNKENKFPHVLSGTLLNVPKLLACALEQDEDFSIPECFKTKHWQKL